ncbi:MAG: exodeoxyribonuclease VII large subunit [Acidimicrobiia bacterium]
MGAEPTLFGDGVGRRKPPAQPRPRAAPAPAQAPGTTASGPAAAIGVGELNASIERRLADAFPAELWVRGEVASFRRRRSKHLYFELVERPDASAQPRARIDTVVFAMRWRRIESQLVRAGVALEDGMELCVRGTVDFYPPTGRVQFVVTGVDPAYTLGRMTADRDQVLRRLSAEGLLGANGTHPVPAAPLHVGVVTAVGSAADNDFRQEIVRSGYGFRLVVADSRVQGPATIQTTIAAMRALVRVGVDVVAIVRGGGSRTDLSWFDDERIARSIAAMPVPVFTGIGHEIDTSVADRTAHSAFKTPTSCAAALVEQVAAYVRTLDGLWVGITAVATTRVGAAEAALADAGRRTARDCARDLEVAEQRVRDGAGRLQAATAASLRLARGRVDAAVARVASGSLPHRLDEVAASLDSAEMAARAYDPARVLERGFSLTLDADGRTVRDAAALAPGAVLRTRFARGEATSAVVEVDTSPADQAPGDG